MLLVMENCWRSGVRNSRAAKHSHDALNMGDVFRKIEDDVVEEG